jgi:hypothetical protein
MSQPADYVPDKIMQEFRRGDTVTATLSAPVADGRIRVNIAGMDSPVVVLPDERLVIKAERGQIVFYRETSRK